MNQQYQSTDVPRTDKKKIADLLTYAKAYEAMELKQYVENFEESGWWYGTYLDEKLDAVAHMKDRTVHLFAKDCTAMTHLGTSLARSQGKRSSGETHSAFGAEDLVSAFWQGFQNAGRSLVGDYRLQLFSLKEAKVSAKEVYQVRVATAKDLPLVAEFLGEALIEIIGMDLRRVAKETHEKHCAELIAKGQVILGTQRGRPVFVTQIQGTEEQLFLEHFHFPIAMRRPRVIEGVLAALSAMLLKESKELLVYVDAKKIELREAFTKLGYEALHNYRLIRMR